MFDPIEEIDKESDSHPDNQSQPGIQRQGCHLKKTD
jgi:hypothetical protein